MNRPLTAVERYRQRFAKYEAKTCKNVVDALVAIHAEQMRGLPYELRKDLAFAVGEILEVFVAEHIEPVLGMNLEQFTQRLGILPAAEGALTAEMFAAPVVEPGAQFPDVDDVVEQLAGVM